MSVTLFEFPRVAGEIFTAHEERGWWPGGPSDPNPTENGVTQRAFDTYLAAHNLPPALVHEMTPAQQTAIYDGYWTACLGAQVSAASGAVAVCHFDCAFNAGAHEAAKLLQMTCGVVQDGELGPVTFAALHEDCAANEEAVVMAYLQNRWDFLQRLENFPAWKQVWGGRENRLAALCGVPWTVS